MTDTTDVAFYTGFGFIGYALGDLLGLGIALTVVSSLFLVMPFVAKELAKR